MEASEMKKARKNLNDRPRRPQSDLRSDSKTLRYELDMLIRLAHGFYAPTVQASWISRNAFIESFAVHCRALIFFLFGHLEEVTINGETHRFGGLRDNDVIALDFHRGWEQDCPEFTEVMARAKRQTDKHIAHITTERRELNQPGSPKESNWDLRDAATAVCSTLACFLKKAPLGNLDATASRQMKELIDQWTSLTNVPNVPTALPAGPSPTLAGRTITAATTCSPRSDSDFLEEHNIGW
jgi:hypothetical protein